MANVDQSLAKGHKYRGPCDPQSGEPLLNEGGDVRFDIVVVIVYKSTDPAYIWPVKCDGRALCNGRVKNLITRSSSCPGYLHNTIEIHGRIVMTDDQS